MSESNAKVNEYTANKDLVLHHVDKIYATLNRTWDSSNRILLAEILLSLIILALASGVISVEESIEFSGLKFKISLTVFLVCGAILIAALYTALFSQINHATRLTKEIKRLYDSIGYSEPSSASERTDAFEDPSFYFTLMASSLADKRPSRSSTDKKPSRRVISWYNWFTAGAVVFGVFLAIPLCAQVAAGLKVAALFGWRWWILASFATLVVLTIWALMIDIIESNG